MSEMKPCPYCKEPKRADAKTCPHCGKTELGKGLELLALGLMLPFALCGCAIILAVLGG